MQLVAHERNFWRSVLYRVIDIVIFLAERNLAFRGTIENIGERSNGNFLGTVELLAKYDPVLSQLLARIEASPVSPNNYLSNRIQNEIIQLVADRVITANLDELKKNKYFALILDCTPDLSHKEQMSLCLRYVDCVSGTGIDINERCFGYLNVPDTTGEGLLNSFLDKAREWGLDIKDCRGQSYDNGANMKGKHKGVQARMLQMNPRALYVPCSAHTLNLTVSDGANVNAETVTFFGTITRVYILFSSSPNRWAILKEHVPSNLHRATETRWESWIKALRPLRYQLAKVIDALDALDTYAVGRADGVTAAEAKFLSAVVSSWKFMVSIAIWFDLLFEINKTSKLLQAKEMSIDAQMAEIQRTTAFVQTYRNDGFVSAMVTAGEIADEVGLSQEERVFPTVRTRRKKRQFNYEMEDEIAGSSEDKYRTDFFLQVVDQTLASLHSRFEGMLEVFDTFGFLFSKANIIKLRDEKQLTKRCGDFQQKLGDIDSCELERELLRFVARQPDSSEGDGLESPRRVLDYIYKSRLEEVYPNFAIALRVLLTLPVTVATAERSFSTLKLIKTFNRTTMGDERLSSLCIISVESARARTLDYRTLVDQFAENKCQRSRFQ
ncbi:MAG: DUF4371 domain-containing protein [Cyanophyceae cyanobacterium]